MYVCLYECESIWNLINTGGQYFISSVKLTSEHYVGPAPGLGSNHLAFVLIGWTCFTAALSRDVSVRERVFGVCSVAFFPLLQTNLPFLADILFHFNFESKRFLEEQKGYFNI